MLYTIIYKTEELGSQGKPGDAVCYTWIRKSGWIKQHLSLSPKSVRCKESLELMFVNELAQVNHWCIDVK